MRFRSRVQLFFNSLKVRYKNSRRHALFQVCGLIRKAERESIRNRRGPSRPLKPPHAHVKGGLRVINFDVRGSQGIIGPRKFRNSRFFNRPVPNIHEKGGLAVGTSFRRRTQARYPERSFAYSTVKKLQRKGKIASTFRVSMRNTI